MQNGKEPPDSRLVPGTGRTGVCELRDEDERAWYRVVYLKKIRDRVYVLHCFEKRTNRIEQQDIRTVKQRLVQVEAIEREEARNAKRPRQRRRPRHKWERA